MEMTQKEFIISDYARDYEMNSSLTSSKRFVINRTDYDEMLKSREGELEYLIEFKLKENGNSQEVQTAYIEGRTSCKWSDRLRTVLSNL